MHLWAHLQGGEAMGRCPFRATRPGGCRSGDHIHEAVTASPRTRPKRSPQGHGLLPNQQRTDALRPVSEPRSLRRLGSGRSRLQDDHRATTEAVGNALDSQPRQRNYCPSLFPAQWPLGRILGTTRRWLISGRFFTYKFGAHPVTWEVNGVTGGSQATGFISTSGLFVAPSGVPTTSSGNGKVTTTPVTVSAVSTANPNSSGSATVTIFPPNQNPQGGVIKLGSSGGNQNDSSTSGNLITCCGGTLGSLVTRGGT